MSDHDDPAAEAARLEAALARIASLSAADAGAAPAQDGLRTGELAARLDALIDQLRKLLPKFEA